MARVLVACEFTGIVRDAFAALGHEAWSCDLVPSERPGNHLQCDVREVLADGWHLLIAHPPCTDLATSGARWFAQKAAKQEAALAFVQLLLDAPIPHICLENPRSIISSRIRPASQTIQPWEHGDPYSKATCLWLKNLPYLQPTKLEAVRTPAVWRMGESKARQRERSRTYPGVAKAMAAQWGTFIAQGTRYANLR